MRPRRYIARHWLLLVRPVFRYSRRRDAYVLRGIGHTRGPVLRAERRLTRLPIEGSDRRGRARTA